MPWLELDETYELELNPYHHLTDLLQGYHWRPDELVWLLHHHDTLPFELRKTVQQKLEAAVSRQLS